MKNREINVVGDVAYVPLTKGFTAIIDAADVELALGHSWHANTKNRADGRVVVYACRGARQGTRLLHRIIMAPPSGMEVDHRDGDGLNNRRSNLRLASTAQNQHNQAVSAASTSGIKGVSWHKKTQKWRAQIKVNMVKMHLGVFDSVDAAASAYAEASARFHGEFGRVS